MQVRAVSDTPTRATGHRVPLVSSPGFMHSGGMPAEDWQRLADYVIARREALGYKTRKQFAEKLGGRPSLRTLSQLETGRPVDGNTLAAVQAALDWGPGAARRVLAGGEPDTDGPSPPPPGGGRPEDDHLAPARFIRDWLETYERLQVEDPARARKMIEDARENIRRIREANEQRGSNSA